jgi:hypothetical protein
LIEKRERIEFQGISPFCSYRTTSKRLSAGVKFMVQSYLLLAAFRGSIPDKQSLSMPLQVLDKL